MRLRHPALLLLLLLPRGAAASIFDLYGFSARGAGLGNALTAGADDFTAAYYNPAALTVRKAVHVGVGLDWIVPGLSVETDRSDPAPAPHPPAANLGIHSGVLVPLGGLAAHRLAFGLGMFHPALQFTRVEAFDPVRPQFYLYQSLPDKLLVVPAVAFEAAPWLSLGADLQVLASIEGSADTAVSLSSNRFTQKDLAVDLLGESSPTAGVLVRPTDDLRLGLSWRGALDFAYALPVTVWVEELGTLTFDLRGTVLYTPHQVSAGAWWRASSRLTLVADLTWSLWSLAPDPSGKVTVRLQGEAVGHEELLRVESLPVDLGAEDILIPRVGVEWTGSPVLTWRGGYSFRPTPLPTPTGRTNYVDSPAHTLSAGASWAFGEPDPPGTEPARLEGAVQLTWLTPRRVDKADPDDPVGGYTAGGVVGHLTVTVRSDL